MVIFSDTDISRNSLAVKIKLLFKAAKLENKKGFFNIREGLD